jgi:hypothetical protein
VGDNVCNVIVMKRIAAGAAVVAALAGVTLAQAAGPPSTIDNGATANVQAVRNLPRGATLGGCEVFPADNPWNADISQYPIHPRSDAIVAQIQAAGNDFLWADFAPFTPYGMPFVVVPQNQPLVPIRYDLYGHESDPGPFPIPLDAPVEANSDQHLLVMRQGTCEIFELYKARREGAGYVAGSGARFDLRSNALRPDRWTGADAAGLSILAGLVRCEDMARGHIDHAVRVTMIQTFAGFIHPATHGGNSSNPNFPAMGTRLRLKAGYDLSAFTGQARIIMEAFKKYGIIVADNGASWYFQGERADCFNDAELWQIRNKVPGTAFEVVDTGPVIPYP